MRGIDFFATRDDLLPVLAMAESSGALKYVLMGNFVDKDTFGTIGLGATIPNLGQADVDSAVSCRTYLVCEQFQAITPRWIQGEDARQRVCIDQLENPDSITFTPAGIWNDEVLLSGKIGTASDSRASQSLMKRFQSAVKRHFTKVKAYHVGPQAIGLLKSGVRLAGAVQSPREFDLTAD